MRITSKLTVLLNMSKTASPILTASLPRNSASDASKPVTNTFFARTALDESGDKGEFKRVDASWRNWVKKEPDAQFPAEKDRYHLFVAYACPWAHRTLMTRAVKGLDDTIAATVVHPIWQKTKPDQDEHSGWVFGNAEGEMLTNTEGNGGPFPSIFPHNEPEPFFGSQSIRELYEKAGDTDGKYSVPILWDKKRNTIVSNESSEIIRMLNSEFNDFAKNPDLDLYPIEMHVAIDKVNSWVYPTINNGVYRCGFAKSQEAYDTAITELTESFDRIADILQKQRFIAGNKFSEADIRLFVTLVRFDEVYTVYFKTNTRSVAHTPSILNYCREIYQMPGVKDTVNMEQIKAHYYCSHPILNHFSIVPRGPDFVDLLEQPHNRNNSLN
jgi:putative glutathione S-transferase